MITIDEIDWFRIVASLVGSIFSYWLGFRAGRRGIDEVRLAAEEVRRVMRG